MMRIKQLTCLTAMLGLLWAAGLAQAQLATSGTLFVDLRANDYTTQSEISTWTNHGTLGDFHKYRYDNQGDPDEETSNTVAQYDITRGVRFRADDDSFVLSPGLNLNPTSAPLGLIGASDWTWEAWVWRIDRGTAEESIGGIGQRNGPNRSLAQFDIGDDGSFGCIVLWGNDRGWGGGNVPTQAMWHHIVWTHNGDPTPGTIEANSGNGGANEGMNGMIRVYVDGALRRTHSPVAPLDIGDFDNSQYNQTATRDGKPVHAISVGLILNDNGTDPESAAMRRPNSTNGNSFTGGINRLRVHDGCLTSYSVLNNYNLEKDEFIPKPAPPQPRVGWRSPAEGRVLEFGEVSAPNFSSRLVHIKNTGTAPLSVVSRTITGPDAARYSFQAVPLPPPAVGNYPSTGTLAPDAEIKYNVVFTPTSAAETTATLAIDFDTTLGLGYVTLRGNVGRIFVAPAPVGNDATGDGTVGFPYASLQQAISVSEHGDVIQMAAGTYGPSSSPNLTNGSRSLRIVGNGAVTILCTQSTLEDGFEFESQQIPNPNIPPPPPGIVFPLPDPLAQVYDWHGSTVSFSNITLDGASNLTDGDDEPLRLNGSGVFDVTFDNCKLINNWGTAALQADLQGADNRLTGGFSPYTRLTATNSIFRGDGPNQDHDGIRLEAQEVIATLTNCDLRSGGADNLTIGSNKYPGRVVLTNCQFGSLSPADTGRWPDRCVQVNPGPASVAGTKVTMTGCTLQNWLDAGFASFGVASSVEATTCVFAAGTGIPGNRPDWGLFFSSAGVYPDPKLYLTNSIFTGNTLRHITAIEGQDLRVTNSTLSGQRTVAVQIDDGTDQVTTASVVGCIIDTGTSVIQGGAGTVASPYSYVNPAALRQTYGGNVVGPPAFPTRVFFSRNTVRAVSTGVSTPTLVKRGSAVETSRVSQEEIGNNVIEGSQYAVWVTASNAGSNATVNPNVINNTIVGLSDAVSSLALRSNRTALAPVIRNNVVRGYPTLHNVAGTNVSNNNTGPADPEFISPYPFAAPATVGVSNYHLRPTSPLLNSGVAAPPAGHNIDRDGVTRPTTATLWDLGAYEFTPGVNPVTHWNWF
jgi:hypothetical protein